MRAFINILLLTCCCSYSFAQQNGQVNRLDAYGKPTGLWYQQTLAAMGEPASTNFGYYDHGARTGVWYKTDAEGNLVSMEQYRNDVLDGEVKYFEQGQLVCVGHYRGLNPATPYDTILITHPVTGEEKLVQVATERLTVRHGLWRFYDPLTGRLTKEEEYQVDELIYRNEFRLSKDDSLYYQKRNALLPHIKGNATHPVRKTPVRSLTGF